MFKRGLMRGLAAVLVVAAGCSKDPAVEVRGTVTFDGQPLERGDILFLAADGTVTPGGGEVTNGRYSLRMLPGKKTVKIDASRLSDRPDPRTREREEYSFIPAVYNTQTTLTADVQPDAPNEVNFALKSRP